MAGQPGKRIHRETLRTGNNRPEETDVFRENEDEIEDRSEDRQ